MTLPELSDSAEMETLSWKQVDSFYNNGAHSNVNWTDAVEIVKDIDIMMTTKSHNLFEV